MNTESIFPTPEIQTIWPASEKWENGRAAQVVLGSATTKQNRLVWSVSVGDQSPDWWETEEEAIAAFQRGIDFHRRAFKELRD